MNEPPAARFRVPTGGSNVNGFRFMRLPESLATTYSSVT